MKDSISNEYGHCCYCICKEKDCAMIYNLYVKKEYRRQSHAKELICAAIDKIRATEYKQDIKIVAEPEENSISKDDLIKFYKNMELKVVARKKVLI